MTAIIKYLTSHVTLDLNKELYQNGGWDTVYISLKEGENSLLENIGVIYLNKNACVVQNTSNIIAHNAVRDGLYGSIWDFNSNKYSYLC